MQQYKDWLDEPLHHVSLRPSNICIFLVTYVYVHEATTLHAVIRGCSAETAAGQVLIVMEWPCHNERHYKQVREIPERNGAIVDAGRPCLASAFFRLRSRCITVYLDSHWYERPHRKVVAQSATASKRSIIIIKLTKQTNKSKLLCPCPNTNVVSLEARRHLSMRSGCPRCSSVGQQCTRTCRII